ncbi:MAG: hypothetical protein AAGJ73_10560 [Pseudomonadota bacterium]
MLRLNQRKNGLKTLSQTPRQTWGRPAKILLAGIAGAAACGGASLAETLTQPEITALEETAASYVRYRKDVAAIEATPIDNPSATREAHKRLAAHDPDALTAGWVAYAALVAADTPEFAAAIQKEVGGKKRKRRKRGALAGKDALYAKLSQDPTYPRSLDGSKAAVDRVLAMTAQDANRFNKLGEAFKAQAYAMQKTKWGKKRISAPSKRISEANDYASSRPAAAPPATSPAANDGVIAPMLASANEHWDHNWGASGASGRLKNGNAQAVMDRVLNLATRYAMGGVNDKLVDVYAKNTKSQRCLSMAKLTLTQCIAATRTPYEEAFCLGEHGLNDIGNCVGWVASADAS